MKRFLTLLFVASALVACEKETPWEDDLSHFRHTKTNLSILDAVPDPGTVTEPINFFDHISFWDEWRYITPFLERTAALEIPEYEERVKEMTTLALVKTVVNYPWNTILYSAWSDKLKVFDFCIEYHAAFRELIARENAMDILIGAFVIAKINPLYFTDVVAACEAHDYEGIEELDMLCPGNEIMASDYFDFTKSQYYSDFISATAEKLAEWDTHGYWSNQDPLEIILAKYTNYLPRYVSGY